MSKGICINYLQSFMYFGHYEIQKGRSVACSITKSDGSRSRGLSRGYAISQIKNKNC